MMKGTLACVSTSTLSALIVPFSLQAGGFDSALDACARATQFCETVSYDKDLCDQARKGLPDCDSDTGAGVLCKLKLDAIAPTQAAVGAHAAACKAKAKFDRDKDKIQKYLLKSNHHIPTVIGPQNAAGKRFYITDHHHLSYGLLLANKEKYTDVDTVYACVLTNRKEDQTESFWDFMVGEHFTWLDDEDGKAISPKDLERRTPDLASLADDPYRTWSRWVRDSCGYVKAGNDCVPPGYPADASYFMEFKWADYLEVNLPGYDGIGKMSDGDIGKALKGAVAVAQGPQAYLEGLPGYSDGSVVPVKYVEIEGGCEKD